MIISEEMQIALNRPNIVPRWLFWISVRDRETGAIEESGIWNGLEPIAIVVDGQTRTYGAAGALLSMPSFEYSSDLSVKQQNMAVSMLSPEMVALIKGYDAKFAPVDIYLALFDAETEEIVGYTRAFKGWLDSISIEEDLESSVAKLSLVTSARAGTNSLTLKQSDESQKLRDPTDKGRSYASIAHKVKYSWGGYNDLVPRHSVRTGESKMKTTFGI